MRRERPRPGARRSAIRHAKRALQQPDPDRAGEADLAPRPRRCRCASALSVEALGLGRAGGTRRQNAASSETLVRWPCSVSDRFTGRPGASLTPRTSRRRARGAPVSDLRGLEQPLGLGAAVPQRVGVGLPLLLGAVAGLAGVVEVDRLRHGIQGPPRLREGDAIARHSRLGTAPMPLRRPILALAASLCARGRPAAADWSFVANSARATEGARTMIVSCDANGRARVALVPGPRRARGGDQPPVRLRHRRRHAHRRAVPVHRRELLRDRRPAQLHHRGGGAAGLAAQERLDPPDPVPRPGHRDVRAARLLGGDLQPRQRQPRLPRHLTARQDGAIMSSGRTTRSKVSAST